MSSSSIRRSPFYPILLLVIVLLSSWNGASAASSASGSSSTAARVANPKGVITLTAKNFDSSLKDGKVWLIEFYAPWCGHCTRFASTYEMIAKQLHSKQLSQPNDPRQINVAKIDGATERALASRFGVSGFPTFFLVDGWTVREFEGNRSQENLVKFATTDFEETEPVPFLFGPFGPMGQLKSVLMRTGTYAIGLYERLTSEYGMKPLVAMAVLCAGGLVTGLVSIIVLGLLLLPKAKQD